MAYPLNPTEFRQPPHASITQQDDARFATFGFNFNGFLPAPPVVGRGSGILNTTIWPNSSNGQVFTYNPTGGF